MEAIAPPEALCPRAVVSYRLQREASQAERRPELLRAEAMCPRAVVSYRLQRVASRAERWPELRAESTSRRHSVAI